MKQIIIGAFWALSFASWAGEMPDTFPLLETMVSDKAKCRPFIAEALDVLTIKGTTAALLHKKASASLILGLPERQASYQSQLDIVNPRGAYPVLDVPLFAALRSKVFASVVDEWARTVQLLRNNADPAMLAAALERTPEVPVVILRKGPWDERLSNLWVRVTVPANLFGSAGSAKAESEERLLAGILTGFVDRIPVGIIAGTEDRLAISVRRGGAFAEIGYSENAYADWKDVEIVNYAVWKALSSSEK